MANYLCSQIIIVDKLFKWWRGGGHQSRKVIWDRGGLSVRELLGLANETVILSLLQHTTWAFNSRLSSTEGLTLALYSGRVMGRDASGAELGQLTPGSAILLSSLFHRVNLYSLLIIVLVSSSWFLSHLAYLSFDPTLLLVASLLWQ